MKGRIASTIGILFLFLAMMQPPLYTAIVNTPASTETLQPQTVTNYVGQTILIQGNITVTDWHQPASINYYGPHSSDIVHEEHAAIGRVNRTIFVFTTHPLVISTLEHARGHKIFSTFYATVVRNAGPSGGDSLFAYVRIDRIGN